MEKFPPHIPGWGKDKIVSNLLVRVEDTETGEIEEPRLTAVLELRRGRKRTDADGKAAMDIRIQSWKARGPSKLLGDDIELIVKTGKGQPKSLVTANQVGADFPATMTFNVVSDLYVGDRLVAKDSPGQAINESMETIPPLGGDVFEVRKEGRNDEPIGFGKFRIRPVACHASVATLGGRQRVLFELGRRLNVVSEEVYKKTLFRK